MQEPAPNTSDISYLSDLLSRIPNSDDAPLHRDDWHRVLQYIWHKAGPETGRSIAEAFSARAFAWHDPEFFKVLWDEVYSAKPPELPEGAEEYIRSLAREVAA